MKKIVILGHSLAGVAAIEYLRQHDKDSAITLISWDEGCPFEPNLLVDLIKKNKDKKAIFARSEKFYKEHNVEVLLNHEVTKINWKTKKVFVHHKDEKLRMDFDHVIIGGLPHYHLPEIKGIRKEGVFGLNAWRDMRAIIDRLALIDTVVIQSDCWSGLNLALACSQQGREVVLVSSDKHCLDKELNQEESEWLVNQLFQRHITWVQNVAVHDILGDHYVKAVKVDSGKVFAAQMVLIDNMDYDLRLITPSLEVGHYKLGVDQYGRPGVDDVYFVDHMITDDHGLGFCTSPMLIEQGRCVAAHILQMDDPVIESNVLEYHIHDDLLPITVLGSCLNDDDVSTHVCFDPDQSQYKRMYVKERVIKGVSLINAHQEKEKLAKLMREKIDITGIEQSVLNQGSHVDEVMKLKDNASDFLDNMVDKL